MLRAEKWGIVLLRQFYTEKPHTFKRHTPFLVPALSTTTFLHVRAVAFAASPRPIIHTTQANILSLRNNTSEQTNERTLNTAHTMHQQRRRTSTSPSNCIVVTSLRRCVVASLRRCVVASLRRCVVVSLRRCGVAVFSSQWQSLSDTLACSEL